MRTWMEGVGHGRVVNNDALRDIPIEKGEIFDVMAFMIHTTFTKKAIVNHLRRSERRFSERKVLCEYPIYPREDRHTC